MMHEIEDTGAGPSGRRGGGTRDGVNPRHQGRGAGYSAMGANTDVGAEQTPQQQQQRGGGGGVGGLQRAFHHRTSSPISSILTIINKILVLLTIVLRILLWPAKRVSNILFPPKEFDGVSTPGISDKAARVFVSHFQKTYLIQSSSSSNSGIRPRRRNSNENTDNAQEQHQQQNQQCPFVPSGYNTILTNLLDQAPTSPLLLIYLHSPLHRNTCTFITKTMIDDRVLAFLNTNEALVKCFGASIHTADGAHVANVLNVTSYPFVALLSCKSSNASNNSSTSTRGRRSNTAGTTSVTTNVTMELLLKMEGEVLMSLRPEQFVAYISACVRRYQDILAEAEMRRLQREEEARLRQEQDREFQEALLADQRREAERREAEERAAAEALRVEQEARQAEQDSKRRIDNARAAVRDEPPPGTPDTTRLRLTLPSGTRIDRRFYSIDAIDTIRSFLIVYFHENGIDIKNFSLSSNFPKRTFDNGNLTLVDAGLVPQAVIMIQDLDA